MSLVHLRLGQVNLALLERLCNDLSIVFLAIERHICAMISSFLFCWFESIFNAVHLSGFPLALSYHLWSNLVCVDELLATTSLIRGLDWLVVAHGWHSLVGYPAQVAPVIETDIVFFRWLNQLGLIHNLPYLFFKKTVRQDTCTTLTALLIMNRLTRATTHGWSFLTGILLLTVTPITRWILLKTRVFALLTIRK